MKEHSPSDHETELPASHEAEENLQPATGRGAGPSETNNRPSHVLLLSAEPSGRAESPAPAPLRVHKPRETLSYTPVARTRDQSSHETVARHFETSRSASRDIQRTLPTQPRQSIAPTAAPVGERPLLSLSCNRCHRLVPDRSKDPVNARFDCKCCELKYVKSELAFKGANRRCLFYQVPAAPPAAPSSWKVALPAELQGIVPPVQDKHCSDKYNDRKRPRPHTTPLPRSPRRNERADQGRKSPRDQGSHKAKQSRYVDYRR